VRTLIFRGVAPLKRCFWKLRLALPEFFSCWRRSARLAQGRWQLSCLAAEQVKESWKDCEMSCAITRGNDHRDAGGNRGEKPFLGIIGRNPTLRGIGQDSDNMVPLHRGSDGMAAGLFIALAKVDKLRAVHVIAATLNTINVCFGYQSCGPPTVGRRVRLNAVASPCLPLLGWVMGSMGLVLPFPSKRPCA